MENITENIDIDYTGSLAGMYLHAKYIFGIEPVDAPAKKQRKIRKFIVRAYKRVIKKDFPENIKTHFSKKLSDADVLSFLKSQYDKQNACIEAKENAFEQASAALDAETKAALKYLLQSDYWSPFVSDGNNAEINVDYCASFTRVLVFEDAEIPAELKNAQCEYVYESDFSFISDENKYCLRIKTESCENEEVQMFIIKCRTVKTKASVYNCSETQQYMLNPWDIIDNIAANIIFKAQLSKKYCNEKEIALLPMLNEIGGCTSV